MAVNHLSVQADGEVGCRLNLGDQVLRHGALQPVTSYQHRDTACIPSQVQRGLAGGVSCSHDEDVLTRHRLCFTASSVEDATAEQLFQPGSFEAPPGDTGGYHDCARMDLVTVGLMHDLGVSAGLQADNRLGEHHVGAEHPRLLAGAPGELMAADAVRESGIVPDHRATAGLPAGNGFLEHDGAQPFRCRIHGCCQTGRPCADDYDVAFGYVVRDAAARRRDDFRQSRLDHGVVVMPDHYGQTGAVQAAGPEQPATFRAAGGVEAEGHVKPGHYLAQVV